MKEEGSKLCSRGGQTFPKTTDVVNVSDWSLTITASGRGPECAVLVGIIVRYTCLYIICGIMGVLSFNCCLMGPPHNLAGIFGDLCAL